MHAMLGLSGKRTNGIKAPYFDGTQICAQTDPEIFFPENLSEDDESLLLKDKEEIPQPRLLLKIARQLCSSCEFKSPCLEYALTHSELDGVWGGTTKRERQDIRARKNRVA